MVKEKSGRNNLIKKGKKQKDLPLDIIGGKNNVTGSENEKQTGGDLSPEKPFSIVGIGASAGGLEAFTQLLENIPINSGMAYVIVQHLNPRHKSMLTDILSKKTDIPVIEVKDEMVVEPDHVYVIPPDNIMTVVNGVLNLIKKDLTTRRHLPIDSFLESLAVDQGSTAIGVILSGTAADGSRGLREIKSAGGITFAQSPQSSKFDGMPINAIATGDVDFVLSPEEIAAELARISQVHFFKNHNTKKDLFFESATELKIIFRLLYKVSKIKFDSYKQLTIKRRILRRMVLHRIEKLSEYIEYLRQNPTEVQALYQDILINVTSFFRDPEAFETLQRKIFPDLLENRAPGDAIRVWVPGCSTGEEAYSIAISLLEYLEEKAAPAQVKIFATDINEAVIVKARQGIYPKSIKADVSPFRLHTFFTEVDNGYQVCRTVREMCVFARQDIVNDPPFSNLDLISCRNVLIYLQSHLQKKVLTIFHYALRPNGLLVLGTSESIGAYADLFGLVDKKHKVFSKKAVSVPVAYDFSVGEHAVTLDYDIEIDRGLPVGNNMHDIQKVADRIILERYAPAGVIVNSELEIIQFRGRTGAFLEPASGTPSLNLLKMARQGLLLGLSAAINQAKKENSPVRKEGLQASNNGRTKRVNIEVIPILKLGQKGMCFLVLFEDAEPLSESGVTDKDLNAAGQGQERHDENQEFIKLKQELIATKEYLQTAIEQYESANEELRAANEMIQTSNEELQSINEELETAKEELQSANEELMTVNEESENRNQELSVINNDIQNLLRYINIPIVLLDLDLRIRRFTPEAEKVLNLIV